MDSLVELLTAEPIYFACEAEGIGHSIDVRINTDDDLLLVLQTDGSIFINFENTLYTSYSKAMYNRIFSLTGIDRFDFNSLNNVESIAIEREKENGTVQTVNIDDEKTRHRITVLLSNANVTSPCPYYRNPDIRMTLHTDEGDIVCHLHSSPDADPHYHEGEYMVNRYLMFESLEVLDYIRSLL